MPPLNYIDPIDGRESLETALKNFRDAAYKLTKQFSDDYLPVISCYADGTIVICDSKGNMLDYKPE